MQTVQMQRNIAGKRVSGLQRQAPLSSRSVIVRYKDDERPEQQVRDPLGPYNKVADKAGEQWNELNDTLRKNPPNFDGAPIPVPKLKPQGDPRVFLGNVGGEQGQPQYDPSEPKVGPWEAAFTRRREIIAGRLAMIGFPAALFWEYILPNHPNITEQIAGGLQLAGLTNATSATGATLLSFIVIQNIITSLAPWSATFSKENLMDVAKRPAGPPTGQPRNALGWFGISEFGAFSKSNELFNGRLCMLGFLAAVVQQFRMGGLYGPGPIAQVADFLGTTPDALYLATPVFFAAWPLFWTVLAYARGKFGSLEQEKEVF